MSAILATIIQAVLAACLDWGKAWVASEQAKRDEWAAATLKGQLAARVAAQATSACINAAPVIPAPTPAAWNSATVPLVAACLLLSGCMFDRQVFVDSDWPVIAAPARPVLPTEPATWSPRERLLADYAAQIEARLATYNRAAAQHNTDAHAASGGRP